MEGRITLKSPSDFTLTFIIYYLQCIQFLSLKHQFRLSRLVGLPGNASKLDP